MESGASDRHFGPRQLQRSNTAWQPDAGQVSPLTGKLRRITILSLVMLSLLCGCAALALRHGQRSMQDAATATAAIADTTARMQSAIMQMRGVVQGRVDRAGFAEAIASLQAGELRADDEASRQFATVLQAAAPRLEQLGRALLRDGATNATLAAFAAQVDLVDAGLAALRVTAQAEILARQTASIAGGDNLLVVVLVLCAAGWFVAVSAAFTVAESFRRLHAIAAAMLRVAADEAVPSLPSLDDADELGAIARAVAIFRDNAIQMRRNAAQLLAANTMLDAAINNMSQGLVMLDSERRLVISNRQYRALFGLPAELLYPGMPALELLALSRAAGNFANRDPQEVQHTIRGWLQGERPHGEQITVGSGRSVIIRRMPMPDGGWLCTYDDVTERTQTVARIAHLACHDPLTDLLTRRTLVEALAQPDSSGAPRTGYALHCIDLDRFRTVNDTHGYAAGDIILCEVARRLGEMVRGDDLLARLASNAFAVLQHSGASQDRAAALATRVVARLSEPYLVDGAEVSINVSIGVAFADGANGGANGDANGDAEHLLRAADLALQSVKLAGGGGWGFFSAGMDVAAQRRTALERDLRVALAEDQFELHYQPLISIGERRVKGFEALLRWRHPQQGMIGPDIFIPICEENRLIVPVGEWVLRAATVEAMGWPSNVSVAVNLSPVQFGQRTETGDIADQVEAALRRSGLAADRLELEITESVRLLESADSVSLLHRIRALGVRISLDDFGTGYSSLRYLRSFPFDKIKIDKSFVQGLPQAEEAGVIVAAIASLGAALGVATTAEGVETLEQLEHLINVGCTEVQGYFFSKPVPAADVADLLASYIGRRAA